MIQFRPRDLILETYLIYETYPKNLETSLMIREHMHTVFLCFLWGYSNTAIFIKKKNKSVCFFPSRSLLVPLPTRALSMNKKTFSWRLSELKASKHAPFRSANLQTPVSLPPRRTSASLKLDAWSLKTRRSSVLSLGGCRGLISRRVCHVGDGAARSQKDPPRALPL